MPTIEEIIDDLQWISDRISTQVRTLGLGLLAITWGLLISEPRIADSLSDTARKHLLIVGVVALGAMICDFLQYIFAYVNTKCLFNEIEEKKVHKADYDYTAVTYRCRKIFFWSKQILMLIAITWFFVIVIPFCVRLVLNRTAKIYTPSRGLCVRKVCAGRMIRLKVTNRLTKMNNYNLKFAPCSGREGVELDKRI
jgi:hypothetical protein